MIKRLLNSYRAFRADISALRVNTEDLKQELAQHETLISEVSRLQALVNDLNHAQLAAVAEIARLKEAVDVRPVEIAGDPAAYFEEIKLDYVAACRVDDASATRLVKPLLERTKSDEALHTKWIRSLRYDKYHDAAIHLANLCFGIDGDTSTLRLDRGYLLHEAGLYEEAIADLSIAANDPAFSVEARLVADGARTKLGTNSSASQKKTIQAFFKADDVTFDADDIDSEAVLSSLDKHGCAWIKGLFDPHELMQFDETIAHNIDGIEEIYRELGLDDGFNVGFPLYMASVKNRDAAQTCFRDSYPALFNPEKMKNMSNDVLMHFVYKSLRAAHVDSIIGHHLGMPELYTSAAACHIRNMMPNGVRSFGEFHQDNRLYNSDAEILTLWFPFRYEHGPMPSLEFLPVRSKSHFPCVSACGIDNDLFDPEVFWRPKYELGDAVILSGFVPHRTYFEPEHSVERTSVDVRFFNSPMPEPIFQQDLGPMEPPT